MIGPSKQMIKSESLGRWKRSSRCTPGSNCVEVQVEVEEVRVRDSKNVGLGRLAFSRRQWVDFLAVVST
jgi:hypothetical protein